MKGLMGWARCAIVFGCVGILGLRGSPARGSTLDLNPQPPDLTAGFLTVDYTPSAGSTGTFTATGWVAGFNTIPGATTPNYPTVTDSQYTLTAEITQTGAPISGTLDITGSIAGLASGTLLTGTLSQFGFQPAGGNIFEFTYNVTGGDLASYYDGHAGVELTTYDITPAFTGSFANSFEDTSYTSASDNFGMAPVPEPTTAILLLNVLACGLPALAYRRSCRASSIKRGSANQ